MDLYLQFGYGMKGHCEALLSSWNGGTVILSPRDIDPEKLSEYSRTMRNLGARILLDPQVYLPHSEHLRLSSHRYWIADYNTVEFWSNNVFVRQLEALFELNSDLNSESVILPGFYAEQIDDNWLRCHSQILDAAKSISDGTSELIMTVILSSDSARSPDQVHYLIEEIRRWDIPYIYLICEPPKNEYLVTDAAWMANVLDLIAGLKLQGKKIILGYSNHQTLITACTSVDAIASGNWLNVRYFSIQKFDPSNNSESRRTTWYYCPQALSEFKLTTLDLASMIGKLEQIRPAASLESDESRILFSGASPTATGFTERESFRHYLKTLKTQVNEARKDSFDESLSHHRDILSAAESVLGGLHTDGIKDSARDFLQCIDINRNALIYLESNLGPLLRRNWSRLA